MEEDNGQEGRVDLVTKVFENRTFQLGWLVVLLLFLFFISWPVHNALRVCWVYGTDAYLHRGIRVLPGKPIRFSDGNLAPRLPDIVTGFGMFFVTVIGLSLSLSYALRLYERHSQKNRTTATR